MRTFPVIAGVVLALGQLSADAAEPKAKPAKPKIDLNLPKFEPIPTGSEIVKPKATTPDNSPTMSAGNASYTVVRVAHGKSFIRAASGATPAGGGLTAIPASGSPLMTEKFETVVRVKSPQRTGAPIDLVILDPRGDTAMSASGQLVFQGSRGDEADYAVEWDPSPVRAGGEFQLMVRIGGQVMGTWPLKVVDQSKK